MRLGAGDPGKHRDAFAEVVATIPETMDRVEIRGAKRWYNSNKLSVSGLGPFYLTVERELGEQHKHKPFDAFILEINNTGTHVYEELQYRHGLPTIPVTTTRQLTDINKKFDLQHMDKNETVGTAIKWQESGVFVWPNNLTPDLVELQRQLRIFTEHRTEGTGSVSYRAPGNEHDDLVMALILIVHYAKRVLRFGGLVGVSPRDLEQSERENRPPSGIRIVDG